MVYFINERDAPSVEIQPKVTLESWRIIETATGERYIVALLPEGTARVTTTVVHIDPRTRLATTSSGRIYELLNAPEHSPLICDMLNLNAGRLGLGATIDVSGAIWASLKSLEQ